MSTIAYLDTPSGISGDMFLGCLVDAGWPLERLHAVVEALQLPAGSWEIRAEDVMRGPLRAKLVNVQVIEGDAHRHLSDVRAIIEAGDLPDSVKDRAIAVFTRLAEAEARVHGTTVESIHFHEVGALDAIVDIVGVCAGLHELGIGQLYASPLPLGHGWANTMHGKIPLPAPATLELLAAVGASTRPAPGPGELVTPTGAALLAEMAVFAQPPMTLSHVGWGAGQKEFDWPNVARIWIAQLNRIERGLSGSEQIHSSEIRPNPLDPPNPRSIPDPPPTEIVVLETNIDDMSPELVGAVSERLFAAGALDVWTTAIGMKKNRPAVLLSVLAALELESALADLLLRETTTLGVRVRTSRRHVARREMQTVDTPFGSAQVKLKWVGDDLVGAMPEYEDCRRLAAAADAPVRLVYEAVQAAAHARFLQNDDGR
ncbi:MAG: nickel pincer cofactor biosynthesis protein LarC [Caldilineaceae bacterium]|nr:nickel pincer cofactor biosynthesis protein LarC [Caldilineaceae bacterium]